MSTQNFTADKIPGTEDINEEKDLSDWLKGVKEPISWAFVFVRQRRHKNSIESSRPVDL